MQNNGPLDLYLSISREIPVQEPYDSVVFQRHEKWTQKRILSNKLCVCLSWHILCEQYVLSEQHSVLFVSVQFVELSV